MSLSTFCKIYMSVFSFLALALLVAAAVMPSVLHCLLMVVCAVALAGCSGLLWADLGEIQDEQHKEEGWQTAPGYLYLSVEQYQLEQQLAQQEDA